MDAHRFDTLTRLLTHSISRRRVLRSLAGAPLALMLARLPGVASAKKPNKKRKGKPRFNAFGCLDVGQPCGGKDGRCCSGVCQGKKPKNGKKDKSRCGGHDERGCTAAQDFCLVGQAASKCGSPGADARCLMTTGNASFCAHFETFDRDTNCVACDRDTDCEELGFGPGASCTIIDGGGFLLSPCSGSASCKAHGSVNGTACFPAGA